MTAASVVGRLLPPALADAARRALGRTLRFSGAPRTWDEAVAMSSGYDAQRILERVVAAARAVKAGQAAYERDSVLFQERAVPFQLYAPLLRHAVLHDGQLEVIDFGGSLGSTYHQMRWFLPALRRVRWRVVEQAGFVAAGRAEFATDELSFHESLSELPPASVPRAVLLSSVLQYLADPRQTLAALSELGAGVLVIDRTPLADSAQDHLCIQHVPARIYPASYPCWIFSKPRLQEQLARHWQPLLEFQSAEGTHKAAGGPRFAFAGLILEARA